MIADRPIRIKLGNVDGTKNTVFRCNVLVDKVE